MTRTKILFLYLKGTVNKLEYLVQYFMVHIICFLFFGLKNDVNFMLISSLIITIILWFSITVVKPDFKIPVTPDSLVSDELRNMSSNDER